MADKIGSIGALVALFLFMTLVWAAIDQAHAGGLAGAIVVAKNYPGAADNPGCYSAVNVDVNAGTFTSTEAAKLHSHIPCKTIQYACDLALTNPNNQGPGTPNAPDGSGAALWRVLISPSANTSGGFSSPAIYVENIVCKGAGTDATHPFLFIGNSNGTQAHGTVAGKETLRFTGSHFKFGKLNLTNNNGEGLHIESLDGSRLTDVVVYYDTTTQGNTGIGFHVVGVDGFESDNSTTFNNGGPGMPCVKVENSTMWHFDSNAFFRCGSTHGIPTQPGYGIEVWNSSTGFIGTEHKKIENPPDVKADLFLNNSPYTTVENNDLPFSCVVTPPGDISTDTFIGNSPCSTQ